MPQPHVNRAIPLKLLVYGKPGAGKTTLAASAADHDLLSKVLFISIEGGMLSVPSNNNILYEEVRNSDDVKAVEKVERLFWQLAANDVKTTPWIQDVRTVVIDSGTELLSLTQEGMIKKDADFIPLPVHGKATVALRRLFRYFRDMPLNVIVTALAKDIMDGQGENAVRVAVEPSFTTALRESVKGIFDHIWFAYYKEDEGTYNLLTRSKGLYFAKTRGRFFTEAVGDRVENPQLDVIYQLLIDTEQNRKGN